MRNASSYCSMRASVSGEPNSSACMLVQVGQRVEAAAADVAAHAGRIVDVQDRVARVRHCTP